MTTLNIPITLLARLQKLAASHHIEPTADGYRVELRLQEIRSWMTFLKSLLLLPVIFVPLVGIAVIAQAFLPFWLFMCLAIPGGLAALLLFFYALRRRSVVLVDSQAVTFGRIRMARGEFGGFKITRRYSETSGDGEFGKLHTVALGVVAYEHAGRAREIGALDVKEAQALVWDLNRLLST